MNRLRTLVRAAAVAAAVVMLAAPVAATTMIRAGLDDLVAGNETIVVGQVVGLRSYWNADHTFILTDVRVQPTTVLKGEPTRRELTVTVMGGTVGELSTVIVAGPDLALGSEYLLFLNREDLPGAAGARTVRDLSQGVFDVVPTPGGKRAVSQAIYHPLLPDATGLTEPPGGAAGVGLDELMQNVRGLAGEGRRSPVR